MNRPARIGTCALAGTLLLLPQLPAAPGWNNFEAADATVGSNSLPSPTTFYFPAAVLVDPASSKVFVADSGHNRVLRFPSAAALHSGQPAEAVLGQRDLYSDLPGLGASGLTEPSGLAMDGAGRLWVVDQDNHRVLRFDHAAEATNGTPAVQVLGQPDFTTKNATLGATGLSRPSNVAVDSQDRLWVVDYFNNRILRFDQPSAKGNGAAADGVLGQPNFQSRTSGTTAQTFDNPYDLAVDAQDRLWVADFGNRRILRFDTPSKGNQPAANGVLGQTDFTTANPGYGPGQLDRPIRVTTSTDGRLYVADNGSQRVMRWDQVATLPNGAPAQGVLGRTSLEPDADYLSPTGGFSEAQGLWSDAQGRLWLTDFRNERVILWNQAASKPNGGLVDLVLGQPNPATVPVRLPAAGVTYPQQGLEAASSGKFFIADQGRVLRYASRAAMEAGLAPEAFLGQESATRPRGTASATIMINSWALAMDSTGQLWVSDPEANRVVAFTNAITAQTGAAMSIVLGQTDFDTSTAGLSASSLNQPRGLAFDMGGNLYVADSGNHRVLRFNHAAQSPSGAPADAVIGQPDFVTATVGNQPAHLRSPNGVATDAQGRLWIADSGRNRVTRYDQPLAAEPLTAPSAILGGVATATPTGMSRPMSLVIEGSRLWVMDTGFNRLLRFENAATKPEGAAADGVLGARTLNELPNAGRGRRSFYRPEMIFTDTQGALWVADANNNRLMRFSPDTPVITSFAVSKGNPFTLAYEVEMGGQYEVQTSTAAGIWQTLESRTAADTGRHSFADPQVNTSRFYRVLEH